MERLSTGAGADGAPDPEQTLENDPEPELKPSWTFNDKRSDSDVGGGTIEGPESASAAAPPGC